MSIIIKRKTHIKYLRDIDILELLDSDFIKIILKSLIIRY